MKKTLTLIALVIVANLYSQNVFKEDIIGVWEIKQKLNYDTSIPFGKYLRFIDNEIHFFKIEAGVEIIETEIKIDFVDNFDDHYIRFSGQLVKFPNGEIWELRFRNINDETRLLWSQKKIREGEYLIRTDDRGVIKDPEKRKKAFEGEIDTYYIKISPYNN